MADRIGCRPVTGEQECLTATAAEINRFTRTGRAWQLHPAVASVGIEASGVAPDPTQGMVPDVIEAQGADSSGGRTRQHRPGRRDREVRAAPAVHARFGILL